ncbi:MAG: tetratricopeptide repeat protein [Saprospiraceae bacterium]|nr:tetratricopeptide repeat protein [Saprospiraceae bacterium]
MAKKKEQAEDNLLAVEEALSKTEQFIEKNKNLLTYIILGIIIIVLGYMGFKKFILAPKEIEAQAQMFVAEQYFEKDSLQLALYGDANLNAGFIQIIDDYGITKSANLANYYAGICFLKLGDFNSAIDYLEDFDSDDMIVAPMAEGALGDAYLELGSTEEALDHYLEAAELSENNLTSPMFLLKAGWTYELLGKNEKAVEVYKKIKREFPNSYEAREGKMEKYITRAGGSL